MTRFNAETKVVTGQRIIMNHTSPPGAEDLEVIAGNALEALPEELMRSCESLAIRIEEWPDETTESELDLQDPYDLLALYKSGKEISPGIEKKTANDDDVLIIFRRPVLDMWCDTGDDLTGLIRQVMIEELGRHFDFSEDEIDEFARRHYQGML
jgi:predicted Zn-dependent protease with MMP-like domain